MRSKPRPSPFSPRATARAADHLSRHHRGRPRHDRRRDRQARLMLHFAYGSNMHLGLMRARCPDARVVGRAVLRDHRFVITGRLRLGRGGPRRRGAWAAVVHLPARSRGAQRLREHRRRLCFAACLLSVQTQGRVCKSSCLYRPQRGSRPARAGYMELVATAAREAGLPSDYVAGLERLLALPVAVGRRAERSEV